MEFQYNDIWIYYCNFTQKVKCIVILQCTITIPWINSEKYAAQMLWNNRLSDNSETNNVI
jgi:hypothetical protein